MDSSSPDHLHFYVKVVTGLLLLLNMALLLSLRYGLNWAKQLAARLPEPERGPAWKSASRSLAVLIITVIAMNAAAIFANYQLRQSADAVIGEHSSIVVNRINHR